MQFIMLIALRDCSTTFCYQYLSLAEFTSYDFFPVYLPYRSCYLQKVENCVISVYVFCSIPHRVYKNPVCLTRHLLPFSILKDHNVKLKFG